MCYGVLVFWGRGELCGIGVGLLSVVGFCCWGDVECVFVDRVCIVVDVVWISVGSWIV